MVTVPHPEHAALNRIEFVPLSERKILVILVVNHEVENRVVELERPFS